MENVPDRLDNGRPGDIRGEKQKAEKDPAENETGDEKPEIFFDEMHELHWELNHHKKKLIRKIERNDITKHMEDYKPELTDEYVFKNPVNYAAILAGVKEKLYNATGIHPHKLRITNVSISTKRAKLAVIRFCKNCFRYIQTCYAKQQWQKF